MINCITSNILSVICIFLVFFCEWGCGKLCCLLEWGIWATALLPIPQPCTDTAAIFSMYCMCLHTSSTPTCSVVHENLKNLYLQANGIKGIGISFVLLLLLLLLQVVKCRHKCGLVCFITAHVALQVSMWESSRVQFSCLFIRTFI